MEFRILGTLEVRDRDGLLHIGTPRVRAVLGVLLSYPREVVSVDHLVDELWPEDPPNGARAQVHDYVSRLRRALRQGESGQAAADRLVTRKPGYRLDLRDEELDRDRFERLLAAARDDHEHGRVEQCMEHYRAAHRLWRGRPYADVPPTPSIAAAVTTLTEQHLTSLEDRYEVALDLGGDEDLVVELTELVTANPLRERLVVLLMRALYRAGRSAEALDTARQTKERLVADLGIDPGPALQQTELAILRGELNTGARDSPDSVRLSVPPAQLPTDLATFTGRKAELNRLLSAPDDRLDGEPAAVTVIAIDGMAGVGKTTLAVHAAHRLAGGYPDGQLFLDLHGHTRGMSPVEAGDALDRILSALGVPGEQIPVGVDERAALYRTRLAGQRVLIVLDNAASEEQIAPLLPGTADCLVLVTSRRRLIGLDGVDTLSLDALPYGDAVTLFTRTVGEHRLITSLPEQLTETIELCGRLPLAIHIAAARMRSHAAWALAHLIERLREQQHRLVELEVGQRSVTAALDLSYQQLAAVDQRGYRLLGLHPGPAIDAHAAAALIDGGVACGRRLLDKLLESHLLQEPTPGRFVFHDLIRVHAAETALRDETADSRRTALTRLFDCYRHTAKLAADIVYPWDAKLRPDAPATPHGPQPPDAARAIRWLDAEIPNLLAVEQYAAVHGWLEHALHLSVIMYEHLRTRGHLDDVESTQARAITLGEATGDRTWEPGALAGLAEVHRVRGRYDQAADSFKRAVDLACSTGNHISAAVGMAGLGDVLRLRGRHDEAEAAYLRGLELAREAGGHSGELNAIVGLGDIARLRGRYEEAADYFIRGQRLAHTAGNRTWELHAVNGLGDIHLRRGRHEEATECYGRALHMAQLAGNMIGELNALIGLGDVHRFGGRHRPASDCFTRVLELATATGNRIGELNALVGLGDLHRLRGRYERAADNYSRAMEIAQEIGSRNWQFEAALSLGRLYHSTGSAEDALTWHRRALDLADDLAQPDDQVRAHDGLASVCRVLGRRDEAIGHWRHALRILAELGVDHTGDEVSVPEIRAALASLGAAAAESE